MSEQYPGGFINKTAPTLNPALGNAAPGVWNMTQVQQAIKAGTWPAYDPYYKNVVLNLHGNGTNGAQNNTFLDSSTNNFTITRNGNTTQGTFTPYGANWSNYFDGSGDYLTAPNSTAFDLSTSDFTIEGFFYPTVGSAFQSIFAYASNAGASISDYAFQLLINSSNGINFRVVASGSSSFTTISTSNTFTLNSWNYVCVTRTGTSVSVYLNGTTTTGTIASTIRNNASSILTIGRDPDGTYAVTGYLSNLRILKGTAVTPSTPTAPLTAITNTSLLTCQSNRFIDNSTNNFTITKNGDVSVQRFSPFSPTTAYSTSVIGGSGYFDGSGDYLGFPNNTAFDFSTGDFTVEAWVYRVGTGSGSQVYEAIIGGNTSGVSYWTLYVNSSNNTVVWYGNDSTLRSTSNTITNNTWNHVAVSRSSGTLKIFINGVQGYSASVSTSYSLGSGGGGIGLDSASTGNKYFYGYINDTRVVKGTALYTSAFTPPTAPLTAVSGTSLLTNFTNAGILDNAMMNDLETMGNAQISTSVKKYGTGSILMTSSGDYLKGTQPSVVYDINGGDFTIEFWVNFTSLAADRALVSKYGNTAENAGGLGYVVQWVQSSSVLRLVLGVGGGSDALYTWSWSPSTSTWYHVAITRSGTSGRAFVNGTQIGTTSTLSTSDVASPNVIQIGKTHTVAQYLLGYMDDVRITKGYARYTANFTAPTSQLQDQ